MNLLAAIYVVLYGGFLGFGLGYLWRATEAAPPDAPPSVTTAAASGGSDQGDNDDGSPCTGAGCPGGQPIPPP